MEGKGAGIVGGEREWRGVKREGMLVSSGERVEMLVSKRGKMGSWELVCDWSLRKEDGKACVAGH